MNEDTIFSNNGISGEVWAGRLRRMYFKSLVNGTGFKNEQPNGIIDGSNALFTTSLSFTPDFIAVYVNGLLQKIVSHYQTIGNNTITFSDSPLIGDIIQVSYKINN